MQKDMLITTTSHDEILGSESKYVAHAFSPSSPRGVVHRAFSVFLFHPRTSKMLLTRRASTKITFPNVWTNACCSHPLHGLSPSEVDSNTLQEVRDRGVNTEGVKNAAVRKLQHELGIKELDVSRFHFVTRFHYWAADTLTYGSNPEWGEHEIDYILFAVGDPGMELNGEEVSEVMWVGMEELKEMFEDPDMLWSPWFKGIMDRKGYEYWNNLDAIVSSGNDEYVDKEIRYFDPDREFYADYNLKSEDL
ncbi:hypothetical protein TrVE_jg11504 [Triparma verrucosa]|nr:hypothetical protein TrVE_jg11504 [Triparma verrucosa]